MGNQFFPNATLTEDIYWANKPKPVRVLRNRANDTVDGQNAIAALALQLAQQGFVIDTAIMVRGFEAVTAMGMRKEFGYTWVPSLGQPSVPLAPSIQFPGLLTYDPTNPPPNSIKVSLNAEDYPAFDPPPPPPPPSDQHLVGWNVGGTIYTYAPGAIVNGKFIVTDGQVVTQDGVQYKAHVNTGTMAGMGTTVYFEKIG